MCSNLVNLVVVMFRLEECVHFLRYAALWIFLPTGPGSPDGHWRERREVCKCTHVGKCMTLPGRPGRK